MNKRTYPLNENGFVTTWLVSGRYDTPVDPATRTIGDQGKYEHHMKMTIHDDDLKEAASFRRLDEEDDSYLI